jgi:hypothetical protein
VTEAVDATSDVPIALFPGVLTHLTRLTRLCIPSCGIFDTPNDIRVPNDPAALPSAGGSLRVLELGFDDGGNHWEHPRVSIEALLPVAAGLESLHIDDSALCPADAARLAAALPRDIAWLHIGPRHESAWALLPVVQPAPLPPAGRPGPARRRDAAQAADRGKRCRRCACRRGGGAAGAALPAHFELGNSYHRAFFPGAPSTGSQATPSGPAAEASDGFVAAVARLPSLRYLSLEGFRIGTKAKAALLEAAPRLSALRLVACGLTVGGAAAAAAQLRAAAGRGPLSAGQHPPSEDDLGRGHHYDAPLPPIDGMATPLAVHAGALL